MLNQIVLMGRLTAAPELRYTGSNVPVCSFTLAVDRSYSVKEKQTDFISCVAWRSTAEFVSKYLDKGRMVAVAGELNSRAYTDKDGNKRTAWEVTVRSVHPADSRKKTDDATTAKEPTFEEINDEADGNLPF